MRAGTRDRRILIEGPTYTRDPDTNELIETFGEIARVWGVRKDSGGGEFLKAGGIVAETRALFWIPYRADLSTSHQLRCEGLTWRIEAFRELAGRRRYLEVQCTAEQEPSYG
ncbi:phage head closure protein [Methylorubrum rhodesianum]|uniref:phage head closure protein n=1 Tax=Methylorubrum rhodesianum TaxID=29427 RepID=UPI003D2CE777